MFHRLLSFLLRVVVEFRRNQGLLLSGAVAYYTLLSIVPLAGLLLVVLSHIIPEELLLSTVTTHLELVVPGQSDALGAQIKAFLRHREVVSWFSIPVLVFFSSLAFTALENAISVIFFHRVAIRRRHFLISAVIPYLFILLLGSGVLVVTVISAALQAMEHRTIHFLGSLWSVSNISATALYLMGVGGLILMLTALYLVMPVGRIALRHALLGGIVAGLLWEAVRHVLVWYFATLSLVSVVYGSLATAVFALVGIEVAAIILLLGAQVIAEYERGRDAPGAAAGLFT